MMTGTHAKTTINVIENAPTFLRELVTSKSELEKEIMQSLNNSVQIMSQTKNVDQFIRELNNLFLLEHTLVNKYDHLFSDTTKIPIKVKKPMNVGLLPSSHYYDLNKLDPKVIALIRETDFFDFVKEYLGQVIFISDPAKYKGIFPDKEIPYATTEFLSKSVIISTSFDKTNTLELAGAIVHECYHLSTYHKYIIPILGEKDAMLFELQYWDYLLKNKKDLSKDELNIIQRNIKFIKKYTQ